MGEPYSSRHPPPDAPEPPVARFASGPALRDWSRKHGFSDWMVARFARLTDNQGALLEGLLHHPPKYIRVNPLRAEIEEVIKRLESKNFSLARNELDSHVLKVRQSQISPGATTEHLLGMTTPQDLASASAPLALAARPGDIVADLAAAPGVKTLHVAGDLAGRVGHGGGQERGGAIVAVEPDADRMRALRFNLERCGATSVVVRQHEAQQLPGEAWADRVLLDAPCTGEGTIPKDKNRRFGKPEEIATMAALQRQLLDAADRVLKPGGTLVYATCTLAPEENEANVQRMLERGYRIEPLPFDRVANVALGKGVTEWPGLTLDSELAKARRFLPGVHPTLGFFVARLTKKQGAA